MVHNLLAQLQITVKYRDLFQIYYNIFDQSMFSSTCKIILCDIKSDVLP